MSKIFEDEFMDIQTGIISLCFELADDNTEKIYIYGSLEEHSTSFNAFFQMNGEVKTLNKVVNNADAIWEFLDLGEADLQKVREVCKQYQQKRPTEMKIIYDCIKGTFEAKYKYESVCSASTGLDSSDVFMDWVKEIEKQ